MICAWTHNPSVSNIELALPDPPRAIWMQLGVRNDEAARRAEAGGVKVVMDRCIKIEAMRLGMRPAR